MFTEICMNKSNHNQFHTRIVRCVITSILVKVVCTSFSLDLANTNIQYKQINYETCNIDNAN